MFAWRKQDLIVMRLVNTTAPIKREAVNEKASALKCDGCGPNSNLYHILTVDRSDSGVAEVRPRKAVFSKNP